MVRSDLCDYSEANIAVKGSVSVNATPNTAVDRKDVVFKNNAPFRSCITKIYSTVIDNAEDRDIFMSMYNLLEYSQNNSMISGSLWNYYRDEINDTDDNARNGKSFEYKKIVEKREARPDQQLQPGPDDDGSPSPQPNQPPTPPLNTEVVVSLKYLSNFWRSLDLHLINCEIELDFNWTRNFVLIEKDDNITDANFAVTSIKLYVPVVTLSINDNIKLGFKRTISWNKYRSEIIAQQKNNNLDYLIDPTFRNVSRLFALSFRNGEDDPSMNSFFKYYSPLVEIKYFNSLIDNKSFFYQPVKKKTRKV